MNETVLKLAAFDTWIASDISKCNYDELSECKDPGSDVEIVQFALKMAKIPYKFVRIAGLNSDNICDFIANGTIDMSAVAIRTTLERKTLVDFSMPINYYYHGYLIHHYNDQVELKNLVAKPFRQNVWIALLISIFIISIVMNLASRSHSFAVEIYTKLSSAAKNDQG